LSICNLEERITKLITIPVKPIIEPNNGYSITKSIAGLLEIVIDAG
jgi:hypothetical protein